jgi:hypothetical protein
MIKRFGWIQSIYVLGILHFFAAAAGIAQNLKDAETIQSLPKLCDFQMQRITSADPTGKNEDFWKIQPGQTRVLAEINGPGCIVSFRDNITSSERGHLQKHVLRMYWDGETTPSVEVPIGDFFGVGFGFTEKFASAFVCIDDRRGPTNTDPSAFGAARNCYFPMPFNKSAKITLTNEGKEISNHWIEINSKIFDKPQENIGYFHAQYRQATPPPEGPYTILEAKGRGHLIGCTLSVKNNDGGWWGEGDEIVYIDGKHAIQGTGSEDYFCESYSFREGCFPYFGVPVYNGPFTSVYRWHVVDPVPFKESIKFAIEQGNGEPPFRSNNYYYSVAYWYQTEPHAPFPPLPSPAERTRWDAANKPAADNGAAK